MSEGADKAGGAVPNLGERPTGTDTSALPLLSSEEYRKRFEAAHSSINKSLLVLVALLAFWLAIENNYWRFSELYDQHVLLGLVDKYIVTAKAREQAVVRAMEQKEALGQRDSAAGPRSNKLEAARLDVSAAKEKRAEIIKAIRELKKESIDLSIIGTKVASQLSYAPTLWLMTLLCWLLYFNARRTGAHRNLAAYHLTLAEPQRALGAAGEGNLWTAPLPARVQLGDGKNRAQTASRAELSWLLGWTPRIERRYQATLFLFSFIAFLIVLRIGFIAYEMTGEFAVGQKFTHGAWQFPGTVASVFLALACSVQLLRLPWSPRGSEEPPASRVLSRREVLSSTVGLVAAVVAWKYRDALLVSANRLGLLRLNPALRATALRVPRYLTRQQKEQRLKNYRVSIDVRHRVALLYSERPRGNASHGRRQVTLHFADGKGAVRLFSAARSGHHLRLLPLVKAVEWIARSPKLPSPSVRHAVPATVTDLPLNPKRTWVWEALALQLVEINDIEGACRHLLAGARLALLAPPTQPLNFRLFDLLAGLAVRSARTGDFLVPLTELLKIRIDQLKRIGAGGRAAGKALRRGETTLRQLELRLRRWQDDRFVWHRRWSNKRRPIWWHHPMETRSVSWQRQARMKRPPKNPEVRQRPIKIA